MSFPTILKRAELPLLSDVTDKAGSIALVQHALFLLTQILERIMLAL